MSEVSVSLKLTGDIETLEHIARALDHLAPAQRRQGETYALGVQRSNLLSLQLGRWNREDDSEQETKLSAIAATLQRITPVLADVDLSQDRSRFSISIVQDQEQGGIELPSQLVALVAAAGLSIVISILVLFDLDDDPEA